MFHYHVELIEKIFKYMLIKWKDYTKHFKKVKKLMKNKIQVSIYGTIRKII